MYVTLASAHSRAVLTAPRLQRDKLSREIRETAFYFGPEESEVTSNTSACLGVLSLLRGVGCLAINC